MRALLRALFALCLIAAVLLGLALVPGMQAAGSTVLVGRLEPTWTAPGGGGVFSAYIGPPDYGYVSPGTTAVYDGREAGIIKAGLNPDPGDGHYWDEGLFGFKPNVTIDVLAGGAVTYDVENQEGPNPVWMTIEIDTGVPGDRGDNTTYQHVPATNPAAWHTVDAAAGTWYKWLDNNGTIDPTPYVGLSAVAAANPGLDVVRAYLRLGMGDSYNGDGDGTIGWVDRATLAGVTYDFVVIPPACTADCYVDAALGDDSFPGTVDWPVKTIQKGVDLVTDGGTVHIAAGAYTGPIDVDGRAGLSIVGDDKATVIVQPTSLLDWNACGRTTDRKAAFRVVNSTDVVLENMTIDMDLVKGNFVFGFLYCDSTGAVQNNILKNLSIPDSAGGYYELGGDFTAPSYTDASRAAITIADNTFIDTGRVGVVTHNYVDATISGNTFYKTADDFGYAIEIGGPSEADVVGNLIYGFDTPALSDGSESAGIYVENAFTSAVSGVTKDVLVEGNEVYGCQYGLWIGNGYDGLAGDVDLAVVLNDNNLHDNMDGGVWIQDEDKEHGSSVTVTGGGNTLVDNGDVGYYTYSEGDGDLTVSLSGDTITGHGEGVRVEDTAGGGSSSSYSVTFNDCDISGNTTYGLDNTIAGLTVDALDNWWGTANGPVHTSNTYNVGSQGNAVSDGVDFVPWLDDAPLAGVSFAPVTTDNPPGYHASIQAGVGYSNPTGTVSAVPGTFLEQVDISKALTLQGAGSGTIVQAPDTVPTCFSSGGNARKPVVCIHGNVTATVQDLVVDGAGKGNANYGFLGIGYHNSGGTVSNVEVKDIRDTPFSGAQHGVGIYAYNEDAVARTLTVTGCSVHDFQKTGMALSGSGLTANITGPGCTLTGAGPTGVTAQNGIQIGYGAGGTVSDCTVSGIAYTGGGWVASGMLLYSATTVDVSESSISNSQASIVFQETDGSVSGGTITAADVNSAEGISIRDYGAEGSPKGKLAPVLASPYDEGGALGGGQPEGTPTTVTIDGVTLTGTDRAGTYGIAAWALGDNVTANVTGSPLASNWEIALVAYNSTGSATLTAHDNCIESNVAGFWTNSTATQDATSNWWGDASGPYHPSLNPGGLGDEVSDYVAFVPWLDDCGGSPIANFQNENTGGYYTLLQDAVDDASPGHSIIAIGPGPFGSEGHATVTTNNVTIKLNGRAFGPGSPWLTVSAADVTVLGPGLLDGWTGSANSPDPGIKVLAGGNNLIVQGIEEKRWQDGIELAASLISFKMADNWIHNNTNAGLHINSGLVLNGVVTVEGNLFKDNGGPGILNEGSTIPLPAAYNSWGDLAGPTGPLGDGVGANVTYAPWTFAEIFMDVKPDEQLFLHRVLETTSFDVKIRADAAKLYGVTFRFRWDTAKLTLNSTTFSPPWVDRCALLPLLDPDEIGYFCGLSQNEPPTPPDPEWDAVAGTIVTFNFTAKAGPPPPDNGPWPAYFDVSHLDMDTSASAIGGQKVFVNNAGYNDPTVPARLITGTQDDTVIIERAANYTGFVDLQGRLNDSLAVVEAHAASAYGSTLLASGTSASSGAYTTAHIPPNWMGVGNTYWLKADRVLYLPTTVTYPSPTPYAHSKLLSAYPTTTLAMAYLLGGDATNEDYVNIQDLSCIGADYGKTSGFAECGGPGSGGSSDVNGDNRVNIQDLSLSGGNYYKTSSPWAP